MSVSGNVQVCNLRLPSGKARPGSETSPKLAPKGVSVKDFCDRFNRDTEGVDDCGLYLSVKVRINSDKTFSFTYKKPSVMDLAKKTLSLKKCSATAGKETIAHIEMSDVMKIVEFKMSDMNTIDQQKALQVVFGTLKSAGIKIKGR